MHWLMRSTRVAGARRGTRLRIDPQWRNPHDVGGRLQTLVRLGSAGVHTDSSPLQDQGGRCGSSGIFRSPAEPRVQPLTRGIGPDLNLPHRANASAGEVFRWLWLRQRHSLQVRYCFYRVLKIQSNIAAGNITRKSTASS